MSYKKTIHVNDKTKFQLIITSKHREGTIEGCHDQIDHIGKDRTLELLRDRFYWPGTQADVLSYINICPRCLRKKSPHNIAPLVNTETTQPLELLHLDYLQIEPSKGNIENVLIITDHFTGIPRLSLLSPKQQWLQPNYYGIISFCIMVSQTKLF